MNPDTSAVRYRVLVIDDNRAIHKDIRKILTTDQESSVLDTLETELFGTAANHTDGMLFDVDSAYQGCEGLEQLKKAQKESRPYAVAIVDMRMPPGWDGITTIKQLWGEDPNLQVVICTAYSDYSWTDITNKLDSQDRLLILKKPFDNMEMRQMAHTLSHKWRLHQELLLANEQRYRVLYDDNPAMFFTVGANGTIISANRFGAEQLGYSVDQLIGRPVSNLYEESEWPPVKQHIENCFRCPDTVHRWETCKVRKDKSLLWMRETARVVGESSDQWLLLVCEDITQTHDLYEQLSYEASHDTLTGLYNRRVFEHRVRQALTKVNANGKERYALCYLDLDQFKVINDTCGHVAGDELLRQVAGLLRKQIRSEDVLARLGGDEFGLLMEGCSVNQASRITEAVHRVISEFHFVWKDKSFRIGASIGLVPITETSRTINDVLSAADAACYVAKGKGRNRIHIYRDGDAELSQHHGELRWAARIDQALQRNGFCLYYQPIIPLDPRGDQGVLYEVLVRMEDEAGQTIPPGAFLPSAERYNLATRLDKWVVETALEWIYTHAGQLQRLGFCTINLSGHSLGQRDFLQFVTDQLDNRPGLAHKICFEVTETAAIANFSSATNFINSLKSLGCSFALDDFGSGLSSFAYLKTLPVNFLKIDGVFIKDILNNPIDLAMVKSIHNIGKVMGKQTIAEFVENEAVFQKLRDIGVDFAQGYYVGRPEPIERMAGV